MEDEIGRAKIFADCLYGLSDGFLWLAGTNTWRGGTLCWDVPMDAGQVAINAPLFSKKLRTAFILGIVGTSPAIGCLILAVRLTESLDSISFFISLSAR